MFQSYGSKMQFLKRKGDYYYQRVLQKMLPVVQAHFG